MVGSAAPKQKVTGSIRIVECFLHEKLSLKISSVVHNNNCMQKITRFL